MKNTSISLKIAVGFLLVLILFVLNSVITMNATSRLLESGNRIEHTYRVRETIERISSGLKDAETGQRGYIITGSESYLEPYNDALESVSRRLDRLKGLTSDNVSQQRRIVEIERLINLKFDELKQTIELRRNEGFDVARDVVVSDLGKEIMDKIRKDLRVMSKEEDRLLTERDEKSKAAYSEAKILAIMALAFAVVVVIVLIFYFMRILSKPIKFLSGVATEISVGNLSGEIKESDREDEVGVLSNSFSTMQNYLREKADNAKSIADGDLTIDIEKMSKDDLLGDALRVMITKLNNQMTDVNSGVNVLSSSSSEVMALMSQLASSSIETATSISQTTATVEELKQSAEVSTRRVTEISENSHHSIEVSQRGNKSIEDTIESMNKIKNQMEVIADNVVRLSEQSQSIGDIINSVNDIAEQSNLLAVNASIEAAKAGEQGKGFVVVAQEIKNLSERSKESTGNIRSILNDIQKSIGNTVMATEQGGKSVDEGLKLSSIAREVIETLAVNVEQAAQATFQITASSQEQFVGLEQINAAMENINDASDQSVSSIKQTEESIASLNELGVQLQGILTQYKL